MKKILLIFVIFLLAVAQASPLFASPRIVLAELFSATW